MDELSLETAEMVAVSISSWVFTSETVAQTSSIQASTLMYPHPMKPFGDFTMRCAKAYDFSI